ncbi:hypothetical protein Ct9H90mP29_18670 [bacterium]|nr:MAG: hypothetical protein Ct9H90mP29_18670 [bacterium]
MLWIYHLIYDSFDGSYAGTLIERLMDSQKEMVG